MKKLKCDGIIFDIDGVLIDVSKSFREVNKIAVMYILKNKYNKEVEVKDEDVKMMKSIPGFNSDWDLSFALIRLLLKEIPKEEFKNKVNKVSEKTQMSPEYMEIQDVYETFYWGSKIFSNLRKKQTPFLFRRGFVNNEFLLINKDILKLLSKKYRLGVASGRTKFEALFGFKRFKILNLFTEKYIVTGDDTNQKPDPASLLEAKKRMEVKNPIYIGDTINDVLAAKAAGMPCIFVGKEKLGDIQISNTNQIVEVVL